MSIKAIGVGVESVYGTKVAPTTFLETLSESVKREKILKDVNTIRSPATRALSVLGEITRGPVRVAVNYQEFSALALLMFGDKDSSAGPPYTHTIPKATSPVFVRPSFTLEIHRDPDDGGEVWKYLGCIMTELGLAVSVDDLAEATFQVVGSSELREAGTTPVYKTFNIVQPTEITATIDGSSVDISALELTISWPVDEPRKLGSTALARKPKDSDVMTVKGRFTTLGHNPTQYAKFAADQDVVLVFWAQMAGAEPEELKFALNNARIVQATPALDGRAYPNPVYEFQAQLHAATGTPVTITVINDQSGALVP